MTTPRSGRTIPVYDIGQYKRAASPTGLSPEGVFASTLEDSIARRYHRRHPHIHPFFQIFLATGAGRFMRDFRDHPIRGAALVFAGPGQVHAITLSPRLRGDFVSFTQEFFDHAAPPPSRLAGFPFFFDPGLPPVLPLKPAEAASLLPLFREMRREFAAGEPGAADVIRGFLHAALVRAERLYARAFARRHPREVGVLASSAALETLPRPARLAREFRLAVEGRFRDLASVPAYAKLLRVTPNHLNDTVRAETGRPAGHWIRQRRLLEAKRLLLHSDLDAAEIGYRLGFGDPSYFGRFFLREEGSSPAAFRERIREKYQRTSR